MTKKTFTKPTAQNCPAGASGAVTISLSKTTELTVTIPDEQGSPESTVELTVTAPPAAPKTLVGASMTLVKTPDTHPENFETLEVRKQVTLKFSTDKLKEFSGKSVELRYKYTYANSDGVDISQPQMLQINA